MRMVVAILGTRENLEILLKHKLGTSEDADELESMYSLLAEMYGFGKLAMELNDKAFMLSREHTSEGINERVDQHLKMNELETGRFLKRMERELRKLFKDYDIKDSNVEIKFRRKAPQSIYHKMIAMRPHF